MTRRLRQGRRGLSEIVGALMLIIIVVTAALALSAFVATYEKQVLAQRAVNDQQGLESLRFLNLEPVINTTTSQTWLSLTFVLASESVDPTNVTAVFINGIQAVLYAVTPLNGSPTLVHPNPSFILNPREEASVQLNFTGIQASFANTEYLISVTNFIRIDAYTALLNDFSQTFIPPTAIGFVSWAVSGNTSIPLLNGQNSFQQTNGSIVEWNWTVNETAPMPGVYGGHNYYGSMCVAPFWNTVTSATYLISLTVTNSVGMPGFYSFSYTYHPPG